MTKAQVSIDKFTQIQHNERIPNCPVCGSPAELWEYQEYRGGRILRFVGCGHAKDLGHQGDRANKGCLLNLTPDDFYKPTVKAAIAYWTHYRNDLIALRRLNTFKLVEE